MGACYNCGVEPTGLYFAPGAVGVCKSCAVNSEIGFACERCERVFSREGITKEADGNLYCLACQDKVNGLG